MNKTRNKSCIYLLPLLGIPQVHLSAMLDTYLKYAYAIKPTKLTEMFVCLDKNKFTDVDSKYLMALPNYVEQVVTEDYILYKYSINTFYINDVHVFLKGRYSLLSYSAKTKIIEFWFGTNARKDVVESQPFYKVLYPSAEDLKKVSNKFDVSSLQEVSSKPDFLNETFFGRVEFFDFVK